MAANVPPSYGQEAPHGRKHEKRTERAEPEMGGLSTIRVRGHIHAGRTRDETRDDVDAAEQAEHHGGRLSGECREL